MRVVSNGRLTLKSVEYFTPASWNGWPQHGITPAFRWASYAAIYRRHLWVAVLVNKIGNAVQRLPLKVYERDDDNRPEAREHPYAQLLRRPSSTMAPALFWLWTQSTFELNGEAAWVKLRDQGGRPVELIPVHPTRLHDEPDGNWWIQVGGGRVEIDRRDFVLFRSFNPDSLTRGLSKLEPLRATLENEEGARRANSALWRNGGRPSVVLRHPNTLSDPAHKRLRANWDEIHAGVDNWAKAALLEEGMEADVLTLNNDELQYIEGRRLNREEACAIFDVPPPVVHILDRATFSNITEQMRSMYRDTMAPKLKLNESTLELELRDGRMGATGDPDFGDDVYAEFLMDEVLRGDFEARSQALANADYMTIAEKRRIENLPFIEGTDRIYINAANEPLTTGEDITDLATILQKLYLAVGKVITPDEARELANRAGAGLTGALELPPPPAPASPPELPAAEVRSLMGRLGWQTTLDDIDPAHLTAGLDARAVDAVLTTLAAAEVAGDDVPTFRARLRSLQEDPR